MSHKVLIIDDDESTLATLSALLEDAGLTVLTSNTPFGATTLVRREQPNLVLLDVDMPGLRGDGLVKHTLDAAHIDRERIKIVLHSGQPQGDLARLTKECNADGFIEKSTPPGQLLAAVVRWVKTGS